MTKYWYNTCHHLAIQTTPYKTLYGKPLSLHLSYVSGESASTTSMCPRNLCIDLKNLSVCLVYTEFFGVNPPKFDCWSSKPHSAILGTRRELQIKVKENSQMTNTKLWRSVYLQIDQLPKNKKKPRAEGLQQLRNTNKRAVKFRKVQSQDIEELKRRWKKSQNRRSQKNCGIQTKHQIFQNQLTEAELRNQNQ